MDTQLDPGQDERGKELVEKSQAAGRSRNMDQTGAKPLAAGEQSKLGQIEAGLKNGSNGGEDKTGAGMGKAMAKPGAAGAATAGAAVAAKAFGAKNKTTVRLIVVGVVLIFSIFMAILAIPLKLLHIANVLFHHNFKTGDHTTERASHRLISRLMGLQLDDSGGHRSNTGRFIKDKLTNMRIDKMKDLLAKDGLKMQFDAKGRFMGIVDTDGKLVSDNFRDKGYFDKRGSLGSVVSDRLQITGYLKHTLYTKALRLHAGVSFKFWAKEKAGDLKDRLVSKVREGLAGDRGLAEPGTIDKNGAPDPKKDPAGYDAYQKQQAALNSVGDEAKSQWDIFQKTKDLVAAHKAGISAFRAKASLSFGITGIAMLYCMLQELVDKAIKEGYITRTTFLMREGNMLVTMAHQLQAGVINMDDFGEMMNRFDGDPNIDPAKDENGKDFTQACAWKRATAEECSTSTADSNYGHFNPDLSEAANPDAHILEGLIGMLADVFQIPGSHSVCKVVNSWFGWVIMGVELAVNVLDGEAEAAIASVLKGVLVGIAIQWIVPKILDAATGLAITGTENAIGLMNNGDAGLNLSSKDFSRIMGDRVGNIKELNHVADAARADDAAIAREKGWTYRAFAIDNPNSVVSKVVEHTPTSPRAAVAALSSVIRSLPSHLATIFFRPRTVLASGEDTYVNATDHYGFRATLTTDAEIDKYDPLDIEAYLTAKLPGTDKTRLQMLGDPTTYTPANGDDANLNDLMHCFVSTFRTPQDHDDICLDVGILTAGDENGNPVTNPRNPGKHEIVDKIYCDTNHVCGLSYNDDFTQYRLYLKYVFLTRALDGLTTDTDPFAGAGQPSVNQATLCTSPQACAQAILSDAKITFNGGACSIGRPSSDGACRDLVNTAAGLSIATCVGQPGGTNAPVILSANLLQVMLQVSTQYSFRIDALMTGHSCNDNRHGKGQGADLNMVNGTVASQQSLTTQVYRDFATAAGGAMQNFGGGIGQETDSLKGGACLGTLNVPQNVSQFPDVCDHVYIQTN